MKGAAEARGRRELRRALAAAACIAVARSVACALTRCSSFRSWRSVTLLAEHMKAETVLAMAFFDSVFSQFDFKD